MQIRYRSIKQFLDLSIGLFLIIISLPIFLLIFFCLIIFDKQNPFFIQKRIGLKNRVFSIVKFRTMKSIYGINGELLPDNLRMTMLGNILRKTSLDELPQLLNVIKGDMSLVGPRPLLVDYLPLYNPTQRRRHEVKPGITGWAQVNGRNAISWEEKFDLDVWYVKNISFKTDLYILFRTIKNVIISEGINANDQTTMDKFLGPLKN